MNTTTIKGANALDQFLAKWKVAAAEYYTGLRNELIEVKNGDHEINEDNLKAITNSMGKRKYSDTKIEKMLSREIPSYEARNLKIEIGSQKYKEWAAGITANDINFVEMMGKVDNYLEGALENEAKDRKNMFLIRVEKKAGKILDMNGLTLGADGSINGKVIGEEKEVKVKTVFAGGHNIQCLHYRVTVR